MKWRFPYAKKMERYLQKMSGRVGRGFVCWLILRRQPFLSIASGMTHQTHSRPSAPLGLLSQSVHGAPNPAHGLSDFGLYCQPYVRHSSPLRSSARRRAFHMKESIWTFYSLSRRSLIMQTQTEPMVLQKSTGAQSLWEDIKINAAGQGI